MILVNGLMRAVERIFRVATDGVPPLSGKSHCNVREVGALHQFGWYRRIFSLVPLIWDTTVFLFIRRNNYEA